MCKCHYFCFILKNKFADHRILSWRDFSSKTLKIIQSILLRHSFWEVHCNCCLYSSISKFLFSIFHFVLFLVFGFQDLSLPLVWLQFDYDNPRCAFLFILFGILWAFWTYVFMPFTNFLILSISIVSNTSSSPFSLLLQLFSLYKCYTIGNCTTVLWYSAHFSLSFFT